MQVIRLTALIVLASHAILPNAVVCASTLREEAMTYRMQGYEAQRRGDATSALSLYQKAAALDPSYPTPHNDAGVLMEAGGRLAEAEQSYRKALELNPNYLEAHANLAMLYERMGKKESAIYHWMKRYQLGDPYDPWTARAEERLVALGVLKTYPGLKGRIFNRRRVIDGELQAHDRSLEEYHAVTEQHGDWP
ncbi:MAG: tetratricopeptide repeat protein [Candidatus Omnitrophica bacterium]|nr:tetratricopeptide repeat protein [Candidatus Omnitrophota bacterium]